MTEPAKDNKAKDDKPKDGHGNGKKELPWGLPAFIFLMALAVGFGISMMMGQLYESRNAIDWFITTLFRLMGPALIIAIAFALIRGGGKKE